MGLIKPQAHHGLQASYLILSADPPAAVICTWDEQN